MNDHEFNEHLVDGQRTRCLELLSKLRDSAECWSSDYFGHQSWHDLEDSLKAALYKINQKRAGLIALKKELDKS